MGQGISPAERMPEVIRTAVRAVLAELSYHENTVRLRDEINTLPEMDRALDLLERLVIDPGSSRADPVTLRP